MRKGEARERFARLQPRNNMDKNVETETTTESAETESRDELETLNAQLLEANARAEDNHSKLLYALADFENYKKRSERTLHDRLAAGKRATLAKFLGVMDNLERALGFGETDGLRGGLEATQRDFEGLLASEGVKRISLVGQPYDPRFAEAIGTKEVAGTADDTVVEEVQPGYAIGDDVLRPARVIVAGSAHAATASE